MTTFTAKFVLGLTFRNMRQVVTISTNKTLARAAEFKDNPGKSTEVYNTLCGLQSLMQNIDDLEARFANIIK